TKLSNFFAGVSGAFLLVAIALVSSTPFDQSYLIVESALPTPIGQLLLPKNLYFFFPIATAYSILLGLGVNKILHLAGTATRTTFGAIVKTKWITGLLIATLIVVNALPFVTPISSDPLHPYSVPSYYNDLGNYLESQQQDYRAFVVPTSNLGTYYSFTWAPTSAPWDDVLFSSTRVPLVRQQPGSGWDSP